VKQFDLSQQMTVQKTESYKVGQNIDNSPWFVKSRKLRKFNFIFQ